MRSVKRDSAVRLNFFSCTWFCVLHIYPVGCLFQTENLKRRHISTVTAWIEHNFQVIILWSSLRLSRWQSVFLFFSAGVKDSYQSSRARKRYIHVKGWRFVTCARDINYNVRESLEHTLLGNVFVMACGRRFFSGRSLVIKSNLNKFRRYTRSRQTVTRTFFYFSSVFRKIDTNIFQIFFFSAYLKFITQYKL